MKAILCWMLGHDWQPRDWKAEPVTDVEKVFPAAMWIVRCPRCKRLEP